MARLQLGILFKNSGITANFCIGLASIFCAASADLPEHRLGRENWRNGGSFSIEFEV